MLNAQPQTIGGRIKAARKNLKISQEALAEKVNIDPTAMSRIENGHRIPDAYLLGNICVKLNISADYILGLKDSQNIKPLEFTAEEKAAIYNLCDKIKMLFD